MHAYSKCQFFLYADPCQMSTSLINEVHGMACSCLVIDVGLTLCRFCLAQPTTNNAVTAVAHIHRAHHEDFWTFGMVHLAFTSSVVLANSKRQVSSGSVFAVVARERNEGKLAAYSSMALLYVYPCSQRVLVCTLQVFLLLCMMQIQLLISF